MNSSLIIFSLLAIVQAILADVPPKNIQDLFLNEHNNVRRTVTPVPAADMRKMEWDSYLATEASNLANKCVFQHYTNGYGQNLYMFMSTMNPADSAKKASDSWASEITSHSAAIKQQYASGNMNIGAGRPFDHVSQQLWADSYKLGCGYKQCSSGLIVVCNYGPAGNYAGQKWYTGGATCSKCPSDMPVCDNGLCARAGTPSTATSTTPSTAPSTVPSTPSPSPVHRPPAATPAPVYQPPVATPLVTPAPTQPSSDVTPCPTKPSC